MICQIAFLAAFVCLAAANGVEHHAPQPYKFGYDIKDAKGEQFRQESGDGAGGVQGSYGFTDARGVKRQVNYVADKAGFRAKVQTNEPGTANQNPAAVEMVSNAPYAGGYGGYGLGGGVGGYGAGYGGYGLGGGVGGYGAGYGAYGLGGGLGYGGQGYGGYGAGYGGLGYGGYGAGYGGLGYGGYGAGYGGYGGGYGGYGRGYGGYDGGYGGYGRGYGGYGRGYGGYGGYGY